MKINLVKKIDNSYRIIIHPNLLEEIPQILFKKFGTRKAVIVVDSKVDKLYGKKFHDILENAGIPSITIIFPQGEKNKNRETKSKIEDRMLKEKIDRDAYMIALGGGVTGDLTGFVASTYLRGIPVVQIPTTLLAQVDSSVGGKTGIDTDFGKNMIGTFYQPSMVLIDPVVLKTLKETDYLSGMGEVIKHAILFDKNMYKKLLNKYDQIMERDEKIMSAIINRNCTIKAGVVEKDEQEREYRKLLNFGHTVGHAFEQVSGYKLMHGQAISFGMIAEAFVGVEAGLIKKSMIEDVSLLVKKYLPKKFGIRVSLLDDIMASMKNDKKNRNSSIYFVFPERIGKPYSLKGAYSFAVEEKIIIAALNKFFESFSK